MLTHTFFNLLLLICMYLAYACEGVCGCAFMGVKSEYGGQGPIIGVSYLYASSPFETVSLPHLKFTDWLVWPASDSRNWPVAVPHSWL